MTASEFRYRLPESRLGQAHTDVDSFLKAVSNHEYSPTKITEFTLVVVTASPSHILLGRKNRGFGKGMYNSFGGKFRSDESPEDCASRELLEETNIRIPPMTMRNSRVGILRYTFESDPVEMVMHVYRIHKLQKNCPAYSDVRRCEEITPKWFHDWRNIPLNNMFADDSHWLVTLLSTKHPLEINGRFHFKKNSQETNTILHYFMDVKDDCKGILEPRGCNDLILQATEPKQTTKSFRHRLPYSRLGKSHPDLSSFLKAASHHEYCATKSKEFTLVVVTASPYHILLGHKNRGFGMGMYNSFGGKFDPEESPEDCASRELFEETNINVEPIAMRNARVGILRFTSEEDPVEMVIHLFRVHMPQKICPAYASIRACEEMTPQWFDDWREIPLNNMFADDSHWLVTLLTADRPLEINGSFHFQKNCEKTNTILHYYMDVKDKPKFTVEQRLFHAIHDNKIHSPTVKEFKECFAFQNIVRSTFSSRRRGEMEWDIVIDVAGGHGALAALFLTFTTAKKAIVVDPAVVGNGGVERAWKQGFFRDKELLYRTECLRTGLPAELEDALKVTSPERILVVACHACQHLSEETLEIAQWYGVHAAVMPCCQKDLSEGNVWKQTSKQMSIPIGHAMDLLLAGRMMASKNYNVRMKLMDPKITPQNRIIVCQALHGDITDPTGKSSLEVAHTKLTRAYKRAHHEQTPSQKGQEQNVSAFELAKPAFFLGFAFLAGVLTSLSSSRRR